MSNGEWHCPNCNVYISAESVTYDERHDMCWSDVYRVEDAVETESLRFAIEQVTGGQQPETRHGCGPGEALPADTLTEGARLPRRTRGELILEMNTLKNYPPMEEMWDDLQRFHQRLADLAGQIAGMSEHGQHTADCDLSQHGQGFSTCTCGKDTL